MTLQSVSVWHVFIAGSHSVTGVAQNAGTPPVPAPAAPPDGAPPDEKEPLAPPPAPLPAAPPVAGVDPSNPLFADDEVELDEQATAPNKNVTKVHRSARSVP